jgi:hypothetical protein
VRAPAWRNASVHSIVPRRAGGKQQGGAGAGKRSDRHPRIMPASTLAGRGNAARKYFISSSA